MSQKTRIGEAQNELSWEEAVLRFLEDQPDFLARHPQLLSKIELHHDAGGAVSLIERQVQTLRARNQELGEQLRELIGVARENDALGARLHNFSCALISARSIDDALDAANDLLRREFRIDVVTIKLLRDPVGARPEYLGANDRRLRELLKRFDGNKPLLDAVGDESLRRYLFDKHADDVRACALIPLGGPTLDGVLALGAHEASRFHAGMGTVYLTRVGELLSRALAAEPS